MVNLLFFEVHADLVGIRIFSEEKVKHFVLVYCIVLFVKKERNPFRNVPATLSYKQLTIMYINRIIKYGKYYKLFII